MVSGGKLAVEVTDTGAKETVENIDSVAAALGNAGKAATSTRTSFLFMSFGIYAMAGLMKQFTNIFTNASTNLRTAAATVEQQTVTIGTLVNAFGKDTDIISTKMVELGVKTKWSALEAGQAMERLAMNGFEMNAMLGAAEPVLDLATIGMTDVTTAADMGAGVLRAFKLGMEDSNEAAGNLSSTVSYLSYAITNSASTASDMAEALKYTGAIAQQLGIEIESVTAFLMSSANSMIKGGIAGRGLRISLLRVAKAMGKMNDDLGSASDTLEKYGINLLDENGNMKDMAGMVEELRRAFDAANLTKVQEEAALATIFEAQSVTQWAAALATGADELRRLSYEQKVANSRTAISRIINEDSTKVLGKWVTEIKEGQSAMEFLTETQGFSVEEARDINEVLLEGIKVYDGTQESIDKWTASLKKISSVSEMVSARLQTVSGSVEMLKSSIDAVYVSLGQKLGPLFMKWNEFLKIFADYLAGLTGKIPIVIGLVIVLIATFGSLWIKMLMVSGAIVMMVAAFESLKISINPTILTTQVLSRQFQLLTVDALKLNFAIMRLTFKGFLGLLKVLFPFVAVFLIADHVSVHYGKTMGWLVGIVGTLIAVYITYRRVMKWIIAEKERHLYLTIEEAQGTLYNTLWTWKYTTSIWFEARATAWRNKQSVVHIWLSKLQAKWTKINTWTKIKDTIVTKGQALAEAWLAACRWMSAAVMKVTEALALSATATNWGLTASIYGIGSALATVAPWLVLVGAALGGIMLASKMSGDQVEEDYAHSRVPDAFKAGKRHIGKTLQEIRHDVSATVTPSNVGFVKPTSSGGTSVSRSVVISPQSTISFGNITLSGNEADLDKMKRIVQEGVEKAQRKMLRIIEDEYVSDEGTVA